MFFHHRAFFTAALACTAFAASVVACNAQVLPVAQDEGDGGAGGGGGDDGGTTTNDGATSTGDGSTVAIDAGACEPGAPYSLAAIPICPWNGCPNAPRATCADDHQWHCPTPPTSCTTTTTDGGGGGAGCDPPCGTGQICVKDQEYGGALYLPDDAGNCPAGMHVESNQCVRDPVFFCATHPTCATYDCSCTGISDLCATQNSCPYTCRSVTAPTSALQVNCECDVP